MSWDSDFQLGSGDQLRPESSFSKVKEDDLRSFSEPAKQCAKCKETKFFSCFMKNSNECRECRRAYKVKLYHTSNKVHDYQTAYGANWRAAHPDYGKEYKRKQREDPEVRALHNLQESLRGKRQRLENPKGPRRSFKGVSHPNAKLNDEKVRQIRLRSEFETHASLGLEFGVHSSTIDYIVKRKTWKHVD